MDDKSFSQQTLAWFEPEILINSALKLEKNPKECLKIETLLFSSGFLSNGNSGNFANLVNKFLSGFEISHELLQVILGKRDSSIISTKTWDKLLNLKFEGQIAVFSHGDIPNYETVILALKDRDIVLDIVKSSILGLQDLVGALSIEWKKASELHARGASFFHQPTMQSEYYAYIDKVVGEAYINFIETPGEEAEQVNINNRYRAVTLCGYIKESDPTWIAASKLAFNMATNTMQPIKREV